MTDINDSDLPEPPPNARRRILPDMTVGQLIDTLSKYNRSLKVVSGRSGTHCQGVKICYTHQVSASNRFGDYELIPEWEVEGGTNTETELAVVMDMEMLFS